MTSLLWEGVREGCGTCEFWLQYEGSPDTGSCKRHPPVVLAASRKDPWDTQYTEIEQHVPTTHQKDWCGEYKRKQPLCPPNS